MTWHAEIITLTLRRYAPGESYEDRSKFASVATAQLMGGTRAYISGFLSDGTKGPIHKRDWVALAALLRDKYGIVQIESERHGEGRAFDTGSGAASPGGLFGGLGGDCCRTESGHS